MGLIPSPVLPPCSPAHRHPNPEDFPIDSAVRSPGLGIGSARSVHVPAGPQEFAPSEKHPSLLDFYVLQMIIILKLFRHFATHLSLVKREKKSC